MAEHDMEEDMRSRDDVLDDLTNALNEFQSIFFEVTAVSSGELEENLKSLRQLDAELQALNEHEMAGDDHQRWFLEPLSKIAHGASKTKAERNSDFMRETFEKLVEKLQENDACSNVSPLEPYEPEKAPPPPETKSPSSEASPPKTGKGPAKRKTLALPTPEQTPAPESAKTTGE